MDFLVDLKHLYGQTVLYYIMSFGFLSVISCIVKDSICKVFKPKGVKLLIFALLLVSGFAWAHDVTALNNFSEFSGIESELELWRVKHEYSKLQRDVYIEGFGTFCMIILLTLPRYYELFEDTMKAFKRRIEELSKKS